MKVYFLNREQFHKGDTTTALRFVLDLVEKDKDIKTITLLVLQNQQYGWYLGEVGFTTKHFKNHIASVNGRGVQLHTVKTYKPNYVYEGHPQSELLIAVGVPPKHLEQFEDYSNIKYWIIVPWLMQECEEWLSIYEAEDIETGKKVALPEPADERITNAIDWLKATSYPNEGYHHPLDEERLHQMANAIKKYKVPFSYASTVRSAMEHGLIPSAARNTAEAFFRAQTRLFTSKYDAPNYEFLKEMMETKHESIY